MQDCLADTGMSGTIVMVAAGAAVFCLVAGLAASLAVRRRARSSAGPLIVALIPILAVAAVLGAAPEAHAAQPAAAACGQPPAPTPPAPTAPAPATSTPTPRPTDGAPAPGESACPARIETTGDYTIVGDQVVSPTPLAADLPIIAADLGPDITQVLWEVQINTVVIDGLTPTTVGIDGVVTLDLDSVANAIADNELEAPIFINVWASSVACQPYDFSSELWSGYLTIPDPADKASR